MILAPCVLLLPGFARGHFTAHRLAVKVKRLTVGKGCRFGWSLQLHRRSKGIYYLDLVVWRWSAWGNRPWKKRP